MPPIAIGLFAGVGGLCYGFQKAGFKILSATDIDPQNTATYQLNFPNTNVITGDIGSLHGHDLNPSDVPVDVVYGGPPCQSFSIIGKRRKDDLRSLLIFQFHRIVTEVRPRYFVMENVPGLLEPESIGHLNELIEAFEEIGYSTVPYQVLNAADHGVAQNRRRLFLIGYREGEMPPLYPEPLTVKRTCKEALGDLEDRIFAETISGHECTNHTVEVAARFLTCRPGSIEKKSHFPKLNPDGQSPTLRAGTRHQGKKDGKVTGGRHTGMRPIHYRFCRVLTTRELARIHGYEDDFVFAASKAQATLQIGNSVPPPLAHAVAREVIYSASVNRANPHFEESLSIFS